MSASVLGLLGFFFRTTGFQSWKSAIVAAAACVSGARRQRASAPRRRRRRDLYLADRDANFASADPT
jgi:hypothetical protein